MNGRYKENEKFEKDYINVREQMISNTDCYVLTDFEFQIRRNRTFKHVSDSSFKFYSDGYNLFFKFKKTETVI
jgi:hypothetical protein